MTRPIEKPEHIALRQTSQSLLATSSRGFSTCANRNELLSHRFPLPGTQNMTVGSMPPHTAIIGSTGAGKTNIINLLLYSQLPARKQFGGLKYRAVIYDPKRELYPYLCDTGIPESQIIVTHPFDQRSAAWDIAADFTEPAQIEELALLIVPEEDQNSKKTEDGFFDPTARIVVQDVISGLIANRGQNWDLRDLVQVLTNQKYLKAVLLLTEAGTATWETYLSPLENDKDSRTAVSVMATLRTRVRPFASLAALWYHADTKFSLKRWARGSGILLLGADPQRKKTLTRINQLLISRLSQVLLSRNEENPVDLTWWFMDEFREAGKLSGLREMLNEGRSKGVRVVLGFQDVKGLRAVYGEHEAEEMIGLCASRVVLHLDTPETREWASTFFGEAEVEITEYSSSHGRESTETINYKIDLRKNALPIEFHDLPLASPTFGIKGWFATPGRRNQFWLDPRYIAQIRSPGKLKYPVSNFIERDAGQQVLPSWCEHDLYGLELDSSWQQPQPQTKQGRSNSRGTNKPLGTSKRKKARPSPYFQ